MWNNSDSADSCNSKGKLANNGKIGFSDVPFASIHSKRDNSLVQDSIKETSECTSEGDDGNDSSCDSCSELTEKYNRRKSPANVGDQLRTYRPSVRFEVEDMDNSESNLNKHEIEQDLNKLSRKGTGSLRYTQPRLSLLGKPISYRMHRKDARYRRAQARIYNFLERPKAWFEFLYHMGM